MFESADVVRSYWPPWTVPVSVTDPASGRFAVPDTLEPFTTAFVSEMPSITSEPDAMLVTLIGNEAEEVWPSPSAACTLIVSIGDAA